MARVCRVGWVVSLVLLLPFLSASGSGNKAPTPTSPKPQATPVAKGAHVLFIGNSYTSVNNLPGMVGALAQAAKAPAFQFDSQLVGGATLMGHWDQGTALQKIRKGGWDYVVLQDQSQTPYLDAPLSLKYALLFNQQIQRTGAKTLYFETWAHKDLPQTQATIATTYAACARDSRNAGVAPVGEAFRQALAAEPALALHQADKSHPTPEGTYLAACVFYASIYGHSPIGLPGKLAYGGQTLADVPPATARFLQTTAWSAMHQR